MLHVDLPINTQVTSELSPRHLITVGLFFIHKTIGCVHQTRPKREKGIQLPVSHTLIDHHICHGVRPLGCHVNNGSFSSSNI